MKKKTNYNVTGEKDCGFYELTMSRAEGYVMSSDSAHIPSFRKVLKI